MELIVGWVIFAGLVAWWANEWGRSPVAWFLVAFLLSPLIAAIGLAVRGRWQPVGQTVVQHMAAPTPPARNDYGAAIGALADLRDRGAITSEEYDSKKADLLAKM